MATTLNMLKFTTCSGPRALDNAHLDMKNDDKKNLGTNSSSTSDSPLYIIPYVDTKVELTSCGTTVPSEVSYRTDDTASVTATYANTD